MMKLIVAEDQLLIQKDICRKLEKTGKNIQVIATAMNGQDAYEQIISLRPDVLITDIRMPIQSGLELIRQLRDEEIAIATVILSGYRDFDYAKEAMKLNVDEYLLKPVSIEDLRYVLDSLEEKLASEQDSALRAALLRLLAGKSPKDPSVLKKLSGTCCRLLAINLDSYHTFSVMDQLPCEEELRELLLGGLVARSLKRGESFFCFDGANCNERTILLCLNEPGESRMQRLLEQLKDGIETLTHSVTLCISAPFSSPESIGIKYRLLRAQMAAKMAFGHSSILWEDQLPASQVPMSQKLTKEWDDRLCLCARAKDEAGFIRELHAFLASCNTLHLPQKELEKALKRILELCFPTLPYSQMSNARLEIDEYLSNSRTYETLTRSLDFMFEQLLSKTSPGRQASDSPEFVEEIRGYIETNYSRDINIHEIATHFSITPAYLSRIFKKYLQVKPIEYLTGCRIRQACYYFTHSRLTVGEVAELCGYSNQFYFSKAFKQVTSMSPTGYRIQNQVVSESEKGFL